MDPVDDRGGGYVGYEDWKNWHETFRFDADASDYFERECAGLKIAGAELLEIGFGAGSFLAWSKAKGARISGAELIPTLIADAEEHGVEILPADLTTVSSAHLNRFDTIVAFDVFEHLSLDQIRTQLAAIQAILKVGGYLLLRFPNPQSPFGLAPQFGDPTHRTALSLGVFERLIQDHSFEVVRYTRAARAPGRGLVTRIVRSLRHVAQDLIACFLNAIYAQRIPWNPVVVLVLRRTAGSRTKNRPDSVVSGRS